jgi:lipoate-protein ligase A
MIFNDTELNDAPAMEAPPLELGYVDTIKESFKNFQSVSLSDSKDMHYKEVMSNRANELSKLDPLNEELYKRISTYDVKDMDRMEALYDEGMLNKNSGYIQSNIQSADIFLVDDFLKFKSLSLNGYKDINQEVVDKATKDYYESEKNLKNSDHWTAEMIGTMGAALTDIKTIQTLPLGTWKAGGTIAANAGRAMLEEMGIESLAQVGIAPEVYSFKKELGIKTSIMKEATNAITSIVGAGLIRGSGSAAFDLTEKGLKALKVKDPQLADDYESMSKSQTTDNLEEHAINLQKAEFGEEITTIKNPNEIGTQLNESSPIPEATEDMLFKPMQAKPSIEVTKKKIVSDRVQQIKDAAVVPIGGSEDASKNAVSNLFKKNISGDAYLKSLSKKDIIELDRLAKEQFMQDKPKDMSEQDWIEANDAFGDTMEFVSGKDIDGNPEMKTYKQVEDELVQEETYLRSIEKCLIK